MSIEKIIYWIESFRTSRRAKKLVRRRMRLMKLSLEWCNVMEYGGRLYISVNGVPYFALEVNVTKGDAYIAEELAKMRNVWVEYMMTKD